MKEEFAEIDCDIFQPNLSFVTNVSVDSVRNMGIDFGSCGIEDLQDVPMDSRSSRAGRLWMSLSFHH